MAQDIQGILRSNVSDRLPDSVAADVITAAANSSIALNVFRRVPMPAGTLRLPVLSALPQAYFLDPGASQGDTTRKKTTHVEWSKKSLVAEEIAVIVPIPESILDDAGFDVWGEVTPLLGEAVGVAIDAATIFGIDAPSSYGDGIVFEAGDAGNVRVFPTATQAQGGVAEDINQTFALVEASGFDVNMAASVRTFRAVLRGARDTTGQKLLDVTPSGDSVMGVPVTYGAPGLWGSDIGGTNDQYLIVGDRTKAILGIRRDMTFKLLDQAILQNTDGTIGYNLAQQDMVALRLVMRLGFAVANPVSYEKPDADGYPFAVLAKEAFAS